VAPASAQATGGAAPAAPSALGLTYSSASIPEGTSPQDVATIRSYQTALNDPRVARDPEQVKKITEVLDRLLPGAREASIQKAKRQEEMMANKPKAELNLSSYGDQTNLVTNTIDDALKLINEEGRFVVGTAGSRLTGLYEPSTNLKGQLDTIRAAIGTGKIQEMKAQSATGATGFGQLAVKELERIEANIGSLDQAQGPEELKKRLGIIKDAMNKYNENMKRSYKQQYGEEYKPAEQQQPAPAQQPVQAPTGAPARISSQAEYNSLKSGTMFVAPDGSIRRKP
jgi:anaerobic ribonucleoside-triphosphate reductase